VGEAVRAEDPLGFTVEFFHDAAHPERLQQRYDLRRGAEVARLDHFNIVVPDVREAYLYYRSLGFGLSETIEDGERLYAAWMYRKQTVHDVAFTGGSGPRLHHLGFFAHESHQVLRICDILGSLHEEGHIERGPGRHGVSNAFYVYLRDPDGHRVEIYTSDYFTGDPDHPVLRWDVHDPRRRDFWGHAVIPPGTPKPRRFWISTQSDTSDGAAAGRGGDRRCRRIQRRRLIPALGPDRRAAPSLRAAGPVDGVGRRRCVAARPGALHAEGCAGSGSDAAVVGGVGRGDVLAVGS
jgi:catechol 2,3-dioxygenase-like lactoylglutathione lyase family enzyme